MDDRGRRISEMTTRMTGYKVMSEGDFTANSVGEQKFNTLSDLKTKLDLHGSTWVRERNAARAATQAKAGLLESALGQMNVIRMTAISCEPQQPGISQNFKLPSSKSAGSIIETARAFLAAATPLKPLFLSREMSENFLETLADTIQSYEAAVNNYNLHNANANAAKSMFGGVGKEVLAVRRELTPIVLNKYRDDPEKLALWETASHFERSPKRSTSGEPDDGNQPPEGEQN